MKAFALLAAGAMLALPAAAPAQMDPPAEVEADAPADAQQLLAALRQMVVAMRAEAYAPGPRVEGWDRGGADPDADLRAAGADNHYFLLSSSEGPEVVMLTGRPIAALAPDDWQIVDSYGSSATAVANPFVQFAAMSPRYVLAIRANSRRVASVDCSDPITNAILYERPDAPASPADADMPILFRILMLAGEDQVTCSRYDREGSGYRVRAFLPDGRSLPQLDTDGERITIVPAASLESLLRRPEAAAGDPA
jgi:hypothetical protein